MDVAELRQHWSLDPTIVFLNHGSFGACPVRVLEAQTILRARMEREPVRFFVHDLEPLLDEARAAAAVFVGADEDDIAFVPNATSGVNTVLRSLDLSPGDELLITSHAYNACKNALEFVAARAAARVVVAEIPFPIDGPDRVVSAILDAVSPKTRLALIDHVTSPTALVLPIERIVRELEARGVDTLVDGAHALGMLPLDLRRLGAAYYTGNFHKWVSAPKGAALLFVRRDRQERVRPLVISHGMNSPRADRSRFRLEADWTGTTDPTAALCVPEALRFLEGLLPGGIAAWMEHNRVRALEAQTMLCEAFGIEAPCPPSMIGAMAAVPFDGSAILPDVSKLVDPIQTMLFDRHGIEIPVFSFPAGSARRIVRISTPAYISRREIETLIQALGTLGLLPRR